MQNIFDYWSFFGKAIKKVGTIEEVKKVVTIMKITLFLMFVSVFNLMAISSYSQETLFSVKEKGIELTELFRQIEQQSEFLFFYLDAEVNDIQVNVDAKKENIHTVLEKALSKTDLTFVMNDRNVNIIRKIRLEPQQAKHPVSGTVLDELSDPVMGAIVLEKGTTNGTTTDLEGRFSLNVSEGAVLEIKYLGYVPQEIAVGRQSNIRVVLREDSQTLDEVVVVGYGTMKKSDLTGAVVSANLDAFKESPNVGIFQSLQGSVPGITIGQTNQAGQEAAIEIRGVSTLNGSKSPLIVVDGIIFGGRYNDINPSDVASVEVLKDPSSKAIYGSQAANGVVLITTKSGKKGEKTKFTYSGSFSSSRPTCDTKLLGREAYLQKVMDLEWRNAYTEESGYTQPNPDWDFSKSDMFAASRLGVENGTDFDWWGASTQTSFITNHVLDVSGGSEKTSFYMSAGYTDQKGFIKNNDYSRITLRINLDTDVSSWFKIGANVSGAFTDFSGDAPTVNQISAMTPVVSPWDENGELIVNPTGQNLTNPLLQSSNDKYSVQNRFVGNFYAVVQIPWIKGLSYRINNGYNMKYFKDYYSSVYGAGQTGSASKANAYQFEQTLDHIINYVRQFGKHSINATLLYGFNKTEYERTGANGSGYSDLILSYNKLALATVQNIESSAWDDASLYQMGRLGYTFDHKYLLTATLRRDGYSGFSKNNKTALFPSVGLGWIISEESFMKGISYLNHLKIRGSYGENGNKAARYSSLATVSAGGASNYVFGDGSATYIGRSVSSLANDNLKWERTAGFNIGLDFGFLDNRISGVVDYYFSKTKDLLWSMALPQVSGFGSVLTNIGEIRNQGIEFTLQGTPVKTPNFKWDISVAFSHNKNKVVKLLGDDADGDGKEDDLIGSNLFIGRSIGTIYDYKVDGIWQINDDRPSGFDPGSYRVIDVSGEGNITAADDRQILGYKEPAYQMGIQNTLSYKQFTLRFFINTIQGGKNGYMAANQPEGWIDTKGNATNSNWFDFYDYWAPRRPNAKYANRWAASPVNSAAKQYQQRNFIRLQDISLSYSVDKKYLKKLGLHDLKVYVSGKNLLTITDWDGWDPETGQGINSRGDIYPVMKSFNVGLDISF